MSQNENFSLSTDNYAIIRVGDKNKLALITSRKGDNISIFLNDDLEADTATQSRKIPIENVVAVLGKEPIIGAAYGTKIEPMLMSEDYSPWGLIKKYIKLSKKEDLYFKRCLDRCYTLLDAKGLTRILPINIEVRMHNGKHLGHYKHSTKEGQYSTICLKPPSFTMEPVDLDYILYHEFGHGLWYSLVDSDLQSEWIELFSLRIKAKIITQKSLDTLLDALMAYDGSIKNYLKDEASDKEILIIKECLTYLKKIHKLKPEDVSLMLEKEKLADYWPTQQAISSVSPDITLYSTTDVREFWAESFVFRMQKKKLPSDVKELMLKTLDVIRG